MQDIINVCYELIRGLQGLAMPVCVGGLIWGGILHGSGGSEGFQKAKGWYLGSTIGLFFSLGAFTITDWLKSIMQF